MLTFKEFAKKVEYLPFEQQKECYKWYLKGARELMKQVLCKAHDRCDSITYCDDCCLMDPICDVDSKLNELEDKNAETEEN